MKSQKFLRLRKSEDLLYRFLLAKSSSWSRDILSECFLIRSLLKGTLEISSDSTKKDDHYLRFALTCLNWDQILTIFSHAGFSIDEIKKWMFLDLQSPCFGFGLADGGFNSHDQRFKLYNFYCDSSIRANDRSHLENNYFEFGLSIPDICKDVAALNRIQMSSVVFCNNKPVGLKVSYGPFLTKDLFRWFQDFLNPEEVAYYQRLRVLGLLPSTFIYSICYSGHKRSSRMEFCYKTSDVSLLLKYMDQGRAQNLYGALRKIYDDVILTYITIESEGKTQFYFCV